MRSYRYFHLDVFTDRLFGGNQLAVVLDGRGLGDATMQAIAKEMNFSETTFVLPPSDSTTDFRVRIFTPGEELPMAGHPTVGTAFALARAGIVRRDRDRLVFGLGVGPTPIELIWHDEELSFVWMTQRPPVFGGAIGDRAGAAAALRLPETDLAAANLPIQSVSCGVPFLFVPLSTRAAVDAASLDANAYERFVGAAGQDAHPVFLFSAEPAPDRATVYSRMFAPGVGITEDAATGGASGPLGCYLVRHKMVSPEQSGSLLSLQGVKMGRPSHVHIAIGAAGQEITSVRVGGQSVVAGEGTLYL
jgi:trans-2,3-dihydro-3-hydroxyanthranilate isomerase